MEGRGRVVGPRAEIGVSSGSIKAGVTKTTLRSQTTSVLDTSLFFSYPSFKFGNESRWPHNNVVKLFGASE